MVSLAFALPIGALLVLLGAGGSIITVPVLVYASGLDPHQAAGTSLLIVGIVGAAGTLLRWRAVQLRTSALVGGGGIAGAWAGAWLNHQTPDTLVLAAFAVTLLVAAYGMLQRRLPDSPRSPAGARRAVACGVGVGVATGFFGVGGGFLIVPALTLCLGMEPTRAVATSLAIIVLNSVGGLATHAAHGAVQWRLGLGFAAAALLGALTTLPLTEYLSGDSLRQLFAGLLAVVGVGMLVQVASTLV